jgi:hypothetical protein
MSRINCSSFSNDKSFNTCHTFKIYAMAAAFLLIGASPLWRERLQ